METDVGQDFEDCWNEYRILQETKALDDYLDEVGDFGPRSYEDGEQEAEWLRAAGLPHLSAPYLEGREVAECELDPAVRLLPPHQAEAVRKRVRTLNLTVRGRGQHRHHKQRNRCDIRDVFRDVENSSTGTRSRSATPDSLDSDLPREDAGSPSPPSFLQIFHHGNLSPTERPNGNSLSPTDRSLGSIKDSVRRVPSAPTSVSNSSHEMFRRSGHWGGLKGDIATDSGDGIRMVGYQRLGTLHLPRPKERFRSGSDPTSSSNNSNPSPIHGASSISNIATLGKHNNLKLDHHTTVTRSHSNLYTVDRRHDSEKDAALQRAAARAVLRRSGSQGRLSFEERCRENNQQKLPNGVDAMILSQLAPCRVGRTWIEFLGDADVAKLQNLLLLEVTALLDSVNIPFHRRKPPKRKQKEEGNVFGVSLTTLLEKDRELVGGNCQVPLIFQKLFSHLERYGAKDEGILRLSGSKHKVESLIRELESEMYSRPEQVDQLLQSVTCHDVVDVLKRLLRDLPSPLFTVEYIDMFYQTHLLLDKSLQMKTLNLLVLMLPAECSYLLRALFKFMRHIIQFDYVNRMTLANVAMIIAPSLFNPRYIRPSGDKNELNAQVNMALTCCRLTETMLECGDALWVVPDSLVAQIRRSNEEERYKRGHKENSKPMKRLLGRKAGGLREPPIARKIDNEVDFQDGIIRINAPQFQLVDEPIRLLESVTAGEVVLRIVEQATKGSDLSPSILKVCRRSRFDIKSRALIELAPNGSFNCFLATGDPEMTLQTHFLYEVGGNIDQRQIEHEANLLAVYKENPNAQWILKCHHRTGHNSTAPH